MKTVFVCSPYKGNIEENIKEARKISIALFNLGYLPICPHIFLEATTGMKEQFDRPFILETCIAYLRKCEAIIVNCQKEPTEGMKSEILTANAMKIDRMVWLDGRIV